MKFQTINPATEEKINEFEEHSISEIYNRITNSDIAYSHWKLTGMNERTKLMHKLATLLLLKKQDLAVIMANEMGKPVTQGIAEIEKCGWACNYYADEAPPMLRNEIIETGRSKSYVTFNPLGTILAIMPWNFPFWQVIRFAAPNLMAGNAVLLKHAPNVSECSLAISELILEAGFPEHLFSSILVAPESVPEVVDKIIANRIIKGVTLTGSSRAGASIASHAGRHLKKSVLELGGSDAYIILRDADMHSTVESCVNSRMGNAGQTCIAAKRFIVDKTIFEDFIELFKIYSGNFIPANPLLATTTMGPLARKDLQLNVHRQVQKSVSEGARIIMGGKMPEGRGYFYPPTILTDIATDSTSFKEEIFGPVASVITFMDESEAVELANATNFGLGSAIFTADIEKGEFIAANKLEAGSCFVNEFVKSDPRLPFGGTKESGFGRELTKYGLTEFMNIKTVVVQ